MGLCNLLCVGFCDLLLHNANLKAEITETLGSVRQSVPAYLQALFAHPVIPIRSTEEPSMHTPGMDRTGQGGIFQLEGT